MAKTLSTIYFILIRVYWGLIVLLCILLVFLAITYFRNHYSDPQKHLFQEYVWRAAIIDLSPQAQTSLDFCLKEQDITKKYPSQIMNECLYTIETGASYNKK